MLVRKRRAFTLVEMLVVVAVIGILVAMLVPAVQSAREAGRRTSCQNNMRQIALGLKLYEDDRGVYPPVRAPRDCPVDDSCHPKWGVLVWILPYLDASNAYDSLDLSLNWNDPVNEPITEVDLSWLICPSFPKPRVIAGNCNSEPKSGFSDYSAITRVYRNSDIIAAINAGIIEERQSPGMNKDEDDPMWDGILQYVNPHSSEPFYDKRLTNSSSCADGLGNTFLFAEDAGRPMLYVDPTYAQVRFDADELTYRSGTNMNCDCATTSEPALCPDGAPWASPHTWFPVDEPHPISGRFINVTNSNEVYSFHPNGAVFAYGDASVGFVNQSMDPEVFVRHVTRADGRRSFR